MIGRRAIVIGTGVIGSATAYELVKAGWQVTSLDRNRQVGHGSTAGSCAIIRMHYSTLEGTAFAWEGYHYWRDWRDYLALPDAAPLAEFREVGCLVMKTAANGFLGKHVETSKALGIPFEEWDSAGIAARLPIYDLSCYAPAKRMDQDGFGAPTGGTLEGAVFWPNGGYVNDPALSAQNLAAAAAQHGATIRLGAEVTDILRRDGRGKRRNARGGRGRERRGAGLRRHQPHRGRSGRHDDRDPAVAAGGRARARARRLRFRGRRDDRFRQ